MPSWLSNLLMNLNSTFVVEGRWRWFVSGLGFTLLISFFAVMLGLVLGVLAALGKLSKFKPAKWIASVYVDIIRGTPTMVQILIIYYIVFAKITIPAWITGVIAFGINSGAYIAEIVRGGILSVNIGQTEAGRSLGLTQHQTMRYIVMPQAMKNILPALCNEFIVLIKETAVIGMVSNIDLVGASKKVQSLTYDFTVPILSAAIIYYVVIKLLTTLLNRLEAHMRRADKR